MQRKREQAKSVELAAAVMPDSPAAGMLPNQKIEFWRIEDVIPYDRNPRINDDAVQAVANSIRDHGFRNPIQVDKDGVIICGHTRLKAARRLKLPVVPVIVEADMSPEQVKAMRIADNSTAELARWDPDLLQLELADLDAMGIDMGIYGLDVRLKTDEEAEEDDYTVAPPDQPTARRGDVWQLGCHRVMCGDSTDPADVARLMDGVQADLLLTDPPYNVNYEGSDGKKIANDDMDDGLFREFLEKAFRNARDVCAPGAAAYVFHADTEGEAFRAAFREAGWGLHGCLVWVKNSMVLGHSDYQWQHEPCLYGWLPGAPHYFVNDRTQSTVIDDENPPDPAKMKKDELVELTKKLLAERRGLENTVIRCDKPARNAEHPTMKPIPLCGRLIRNSSLPGQLVLDLFGGSGSTLIACEQLSRQCYTMEYDPRYVDVIVDRWEKLTGEKAEKI